MCALPRSSRAAVMVDFDTPLTVEAVRLREPRPGDVVVRLAASGICRTDHSVLHAALPYPPPLVLGHEGAGVVEEVGAAVRHLQPGDHVVLSTIPGCGRCPYCRAGHFHLCDAGLQAALAGEQAGFVRADGSDVAAFCGLGTFATRTVVDAGAAIKIDDDIPLDRACLLGCGVITGVGAVLNTARVAAGETVAVLGCGGVGINVIQGARLAGAARIVAVDVSARKLEQARAFGATDVLDVHDSAGDDASDAVRALVGGGLGVDVAFEAVGSAASIRQAFLATRRGGRAVIVGVAPFGVEAAVPAAMLTLDERALIGSFYGSALMSRDVPRLCELYRRGRLQLDELISRRLRLDDVNAGLDALDGGDVLRSVIVYD